jgi:hypothetical protein
MTEDRGDTLEDLFESQESESQEPETQESESQEPEAQEPESQEPEKARQKDKDIRIPKARFDEVIAKARARERELLEELERLRAQIPQSQQPQPQSSVPDPVAQELAALEERYEQLIFDGEQEAAKEVRRKIQELRDKYVETRVRAQLDSVRNVVLDDVKFNALVAQLEAQYPQLNAASPEYDEELTKEVATLTLGLTQAGMSRYEALQKAVKYVFKSSVDVVGETRTRQARDKAAKANKAQPPSVTRGQAPTDKDFGIDINNLTPEALAKLDPQTLSKLRGDLL